MKLPSVPVPKGFRLLKEKWLRAGNLIPFGTIVLVKEHKHDVTKWDPWWAPGHSIHNDVDEYFFAAPFCEHCGKFTHEQ